MKPLAEVNKSHISEAGVHGAPLEFFGKAIVGFVDLLGFSASVDSLWGDSVDSPLARLLRIKEAVERLPHFRLLGFVPGKGYQALHGCRVHTVSDGIVVCAALPESGSLNDFLSAVSTVSNAMQVAWAAAIREGFSVRGAVECGPIYWSEHETIGPVFNGAYGKENKIAKTSRIIVGPKCIGKILQMLEADKSLDQWPDWPAAHWFTISGGPQEPELIELAPLHLWEEYKAGRAPLDPIANVAGQNSWRYQGILEKLKADKPSPPATIEELRKGQGRIIEILRSTK